MAFDDLQRPLDLPDALPLAPLDSQRFNRRIGRLTLGRPEDLDPDAILAAARRGGLDLLILRYPAACIQAFARFCALAPRVLFADTLLYYLRPLDGPALPAPAWPPGAKLLLGTAAHRDDLDRLTRAIFQGYTTHYRANPALPDSDITDGYAQWAAAYLDHPQRAALLPTWDGQPVGLCTLDLLPIAEIALIGVEAAHRRLHLASHLLDAAARLAQSRGASALTISTQAQNIPVQRAWTQRGFRLEAALTTLHIHLTPDAP